MKHLTKNRRGISVVELLIAFTLVSFILIVIAALYFAQHRLFTNQNSAIIASSQNKIALDEITNQIREASGIANSCCTSETTGSSSIILKIWPQDTSGEPIDPGTTNFDYIIYKRDPANATYLIKVVVPSGISGRKSQNKIIATNISTLSDGLQITYDNADPALAAEVSVSITTRDATGSKVQSITQSSKAVIRNK